MITINKIARREKIRKRIRRKLAGTAECPRLSVFRSNKEIYAQLIDDETGKTLAQASTRDKQMGGAKGKKVEQAKKVGQLLAERAGAAGLSVVVFDRGGYLYHGRVKSRAEGAREGGLKF